MNTQELLVALQRDAESFSLAQLKAQLRTEMGFERDEAEEIHPTKMTSFYVIVMIRIKESEHVDRILPVNEKELRKFREELAAYMDLYAPGRVKLKCYIMTICTYLQFVEKRPLHAVGMKMENGLPLYFDGIAYRCPVKQQNLKSGPSLCGYCVAIPYAGSEQTGP
jgi:uncharacterized protein (UPF0305 family)